jgi:hypothetical protein
MTEPESSSTAGADSGVNPQEPDLRVAHNESNTRVSKTASAQAVENSFASDVSKPYGLQADPDGEDQDSRSS